MDEKLDFIRAVFTKEQIHYFIFWNYLTFWITGHIYLPEQYNSISCILVQDKGHKHDLYNVIFMHVSKVRTVRNNFYSQPIYTDYLSEYKNIEEWIVHSLIQNIDD